MDELIELGFYTRDGTHYIYGNVVVTIDDDGYVCNGNKMTIDAIEMMISDC